MSLRDMLEQMERTRVGEEASDLFWGNLSGAALKKTLISIAASSLIFALAASAFHLLPIAEWLEDCRIPFRAIVPECSTLSLEALSGFVPSILILTAGSYLFVRSQTGRRFQASALSTAILLVCSAVWLGWLGIGGLLLAAVLLAVFLAAFAGYRLALR